MRLITSAPLAAFVIVNVLFHGIEDEVAEGAVGEIQDITALHPQEAFQQALVLDGERTHGCGSAGGNAGDL
jgi:hypothetical protein